MFAQALLALTVLAQIDQTVPVKKGAKLDVSNFSGQVVIKTWDREEVRVELAHPERDTIDIRTTDQAVTIRSDRGNGRPRSLDYTITVPEWMAISVSGTATDVTIEGAGADIAVETVRGDVRVRGGSGFVRLRSLQGSVWLEGAKGRIETRTYNQGIRLTAVSGDISAEAINGGIVLEHVDSSEADVSTINGRISYEGTIKDKGAYRLSTHNGRIDMVLAEAANATVTVRTYNGELRSTLPGQFSEATGRRRTVIFGNGSAHVELNTFNGLISLRRPGEPSPAPDDRGNRNRRRRIRP
jgi:DUF4097 and DUF4098 domain-containing protein YvlB